MKADTTGYDFQLINSFNKTITALSKKKFSTKRDTNFVADLCKKDINAQFDFISSIVEGQFNSVDTFINQGESVAVPYLGTFKFVQGKVIYNDVRNEILESKGYSEFNDILDFNTKLEVKKEVKDETINRLKIFNVNNRRIGNRNIPLSISLVPVRK